MRVIKYTTEHLVSYEAKDQQNQTHHQIFEKENPERPIAIYSSEFDKLHLADEFPQNAREYKYFNEMCEIMQLLYSLKKPPTVGFDK